MVRPGAENARMSAQHSASKESQPYAWESEPSEERPSAFSHETGDCSLGAAMVRGRISRWPGILQLVGALLVGFGIDRHDRDERMAADLTWPTLRGVRACLCTR
jgi:hypothetical protein